MDVALVSVGLPSQNCAVETARSEEISATRLPYEPAGSLRPEALRRHRQGTEAGREQRALYKSRSGFHRSSPVWIHSLRSWRHTSNAARVDEALASTTLSSGRCRQAMAVMAVGSVPNN